MTVSSRLGGDQSNDLPVNVIGAIIHASMPKANAMSDKHYLAFLGVEGRDNWFFVMDLSSGHHDEA